MNNDPTTYHGESPDNTMSLARQLKRTAAALTRRDLAARATRACAAADAAHLMAVSA